MEFIEIANSTVDTSDAITLFEGNQMVFVVNGKIKKIVDFLNTKLSISSALDVPPLRGDWLTQETTNAVMIVQHVSPDKKSIYGYKISEADFNTTDLITSNDAGGQTMTPTSFVPESVTAPQPHCYDWTKHPSKSESLPERAYLGCMYMGRAVLSGNPSDPNQWYMSRQNDPFDWDYGAADAQTPVAGETSLAGKAGDIIRALIPYNDDYLIFGCASSLWAMQGDPAAGGTLFQVSNTTGIFSDTSWCFDDNGNLFFLGDAGIYQMSVGQGISKPNNITALALPRLRQDLDLNRKTHQVTMSYDKKRHGILITSTELATGNNQNYWFDGLTQGFFPETYSPATAVYSAHYYDAEDESESGLLVGGQDGFIRMHDDTLRYDEGPFDRAIESECLLPIIPLGEDSSKAGRIISLQVVTAGNQFDEDAADTDSVVYELHSGDCPENVLSKIKQEKTPLHTGTFTGAGKQFRIRKKLRGRNAGLLLKSNTLNHTWAIETIEIDGMPSGSE